MTIQVLKIVKTVRFDHNISPTQSTRPNRNALWDVGIKVCCRRIARVKVTLNKFQPIGNVGVFRLTLTKPHSLRTTIFFEGGPAPRVSAPLPTAAAPGSPFPPPTAWREGPAHCIAAARAAAGPRVGAPPSLAGLPQWPQRAAPDGSVHAHGNRRTVRRGSHRHGAAAAPGPWPLPPAAHGSAADGGPARRPLPAPRHRRRRGDTPPVIRASPHRYSESRAGVRR